MSTSVARVACLSWLVVACGTCLAGGHSHPGGQQDPKQQKNQPAPQNPATESFDPDAVNQVVTKTAAGGIRRVVANETSDATQIGLIRTRLKSLADRFGPASFAGAVPGIDPPTPAIAALQSAAPEQLHAQYLEVRGGAEVRYVADDPALVRALQAWLDLPWPGPGTGARSPPDRTVFPRAVR